MRYQLTPASGRQDQSRLRSRNAPSTQDHGSVTHPVSVTLFTGPDPGTVRAWAHLVSSTPGGDVTQLPAWADLWRQAGFLPLYLLARQDDRLVGGALVLQRQLPVLGVVGYLPYGPVLAPWAPRDATAR
ncbi:MAG TPA: hypothetical protein VFQ77_04800, partial [Pseudonocardiaceae bacterium]|nr:hypothetical protein [Pseudonocardiaceae bacterium]